MSFNKLSPYIAIAIDWLEASPVQPDGAILFHLGISLTESPYERVSMSLCPRGYTTKPILWFKVKNAEYFEDCAINSFTEEEKSEFIAITSALTPINEHWSGDDFLSIELTNFASDEILRMLNNYSIGCRECAVEKHYKGSVFCGSWYSKGSSKAILPLGWA